MNFSCDRTLIYEAVVSASKSIPAKSALPVLSCFLFEAFDDNRISVTGFDMDMGITATIEGTVLVPGKMSIDAKMLIDILRNMEIGEVTFIENENKTVNVFGGSTEFVLPFIDGDSFPERPSAEGCEYITVDQKTLHSMIRQTLFAVSQTDVKSIYTGTFFDINDGLIKAVATDTFRFAIRKEIYESELPFAFIVQGRVLSELIKIMKNDDGLVRIGLTPRHAVFEFDNCRMISRLVDGVYMNYRQIIPKSFKYVITLNSKELKKVVERASVLINDKMKAPVRMSLEENKIVISCRTADGHSFDDEVAADYCGEAFEIGINNKSFLDVLNACECDEIVMKMNTALSSICIVPKEGESFLYLIAPMRLKGYATDNT